MLVPFDTDDLFAVANLIVAVLFGCAENARLENDRNLSISLQKIDLHSNCSPGARFSKNLRKFLRKSYEN